MDGLNCAISDLIYPSKDNVDTGAETETDGYDSADLLQYAALSVLDSPDYSNPANLDKTPRFEAHRSILLRVLGPARRE